VIALIVLLAAAGTTTAVPSLRPLVESLGGGAGAGALFVSAHVIGQVLGAFSVRRGLAAAGELAARRMVVGGLVASAALTAVMALVVHERWGLAPLIALRAADGAAHVAVVMGLLGISRGERRLRWLGALLVVGVALGLFGGAGLTRYAPAVAVGAAALLAALAVPLALVAVPARVPREARPRGPAEAPATSVISVGAMRFSFGVLTAGLPFLAGGDDWRVGATFGTMMLASIATLPVVAGLAHRAGWDLVARGSALLLAACLAAIAVPGLIGSYAGFGWAPIAGIGAAGIYAAALAALAAIDDAGRRTGAVGVVHAAGSAGHAAGALIAGAVMSRHGLDVAPATATALLGALAVGVAGILLLVRGDGPDRAP
jgi:hypothetical protein